MNEQSTILFSIIIESIETSLAFIVDWYVILLIQNHFNFATETAIIIVFYYFQSDMILCNNSKRFNVYFMSSNAAIFCPLSFLTLIFSFLFVLCVFIEIMYFFCNDNTCFFIDYFVILFQSNVKHWTNGFEN